MSGPQKITGKEILILLENLLKNKILLRFHLKNSDFGSVTLIIDINKDKKNPRFRIDYSPGFSQNLSKVKEMDLYFDFLGEDNIQYSFRTFGGHFSGDKIWINFPEYIDRLQRRKDFRLKVPLGTKLYLETETKGQKMNVINISLGGLLGQYATIKSDTEYYNDIKVGKILNDIEIVFPYKNEDTYIKINKSEVKRINQDSKLKQTHYALQFVSIDKIERNKLVELLYEYQAQLLRERLPF